MAAKKMLVPLDMVQNEIQNPVAQNLSGNPSSPLNGQWYYNTTTNKFMWRADDVWVDPLSRDNHVGTQAASTISDFDDAVRTSRLDQMAAPTGSVNLNSQKVTNLANGTSSGDAVNFGQLQAVAQGRDFKDSVRAKTATALPANTYNNGASGVGATITGNANGALPAQDGVTLVVDDRLLVSEDTTKNGIYVVTQVGSGGSPFILTRATDADTAVKVTAGMSVMVEEGTEYANEHWTLTTDGAIVIGTTSLVFAQTGAGTTYTQGTGISISGSTIAVDTSVVVRKYAASVGDNSATSFDLSHGLASTDVTVQVFDNSNGATVDADTVRLSSTQVRVSFASAPTTNQYRVVIHG